MADAANDQTFQRLVQDGASYRRLREEFAAGCVTALDGAGGKPFLDDYRNLVDECARTNNAVIDAFQLSAIEVIVLRTLLLGTLKWHPLALALAPREASAIEFLRAQQAAWQASGQACSAGRDDWQAVLAVLGQAPLAEQAAGKRLAALQRISMAHPLVLLLQPQVPLPTLDEDANAITRADLVFVDVASGRVALGVECVGFEAHPALADDARALADVLASAATAPWLKFSGIDLFRDPIAVTGKILQRLNRR